MKSEKRITISEPTVVFCPAWLQKKILHNLAKATLEKINPRRVQKAKDILATIKSKGNLDDLPSIVSSTTIASTVDDRKLCQAVVPSNRLRLSAHAKVMFVKCKKYTSSFINRIRFWQPAYGGQAKSEN